MPRKKDTDYLIPFDDDGNLMSYPAKRYSRNGIWVPTMKENYVFEATLTYAGFDNGIRSAHRVIWKDSEGHTYPMFISQLGPALETHGMQGNTMTGRWTFMKQGENYSIRAVKPDKKAAPKKTTKKVKVKAPARVEARAERVERLEQDCETLRATVDAWNKVTAEVLAAPIYAHIHKRVSDIITK